MHLYKTIFFFRNNSSATRLQEQLRSGIESFSVHKNKQRRLKSPCMRTERSNIKMLISVTSRVNKKFQTRTKSLPINHAFLSPFCLACNTVTAVAVSCGNSRLKPEASRQSWSNESPLLGGENYENTRRPTALCNSSNYPTAKKSELMAVQVPHDPSHQSERLPYSKLCPPIKCREHGSGQ